jgi:hypothetical protein
MQGIECTCEYRVSNDGATQCTPLACPFVEGLHTSKEGSTEHIHHRAKQQCKAWYLSIEHLSGVLLSINVDLTKLLHNFALPPYMGLHGLTAAK